MNLRYPVYLTRILSSLVAGMLILSLIRFELCFLKKQDLSVVNDKTCFLIGFYGKSDNNNNGSSSSNDNSKCYSHILSVLYLKINIFTIALSFFVGELFSGLGELWVLDFLFGNFRRSSVNNFILENMEWNVCNQERMRMLTIHIMIFFISLLFMLFMYYKLLPILAILALCLFMWFSVLSKVRAGRDSDFTKNSAKCFACFFILYYVPFFSLFVSGKLSNNQGYGFSNYSIKFSVFSDFTERNERAFSLSEMYFNMSRIFGGLMILFWLMFWFWTAMYFYHKKSFDYLIIALTNQLLLMFSFIQATNQREFANKLIYFSK